MKAITALGVLALATVLGSTRAAADLPVEMLSCFEEGTYCAEAPFDTLETYGNDCGQTFRVVHGRVAFPPLRNAGPVTIRVRTYSGPATAPLYVIVRGPSRGGLGCTTYLAGSLVLISYGFPTQCGGVWESVGPIDLTRNGVPAGTEYHVQLEGFRGYGGRSSAVACVQVIRDSTTAVEDISWGNIKRLYSDPRN